MDAVQLDPFEPELLRGLRDHVHDRIRKAIISGQLKSGEKLNERKLAAELGISTTPLKEAMRQLQSEGLIRTEARRGSFVIFNARQAEEMTLARAALEGMIARQAAKRVKNSDLVSLRATLDQMKAALGAVDIQGLIDLNEKFHDGIHEASECQYLHWLQSSQRMYNDATRLIVLADVGERERAFEEHKAILEAISDRDEDLAERTMRDHVIAAGEKHIRAIFDQEEKSREV